MPDAPHYDHRHHHHHRRYPHPSNTSDTTTTPTVAATTIKNIRYEHDTHPAPPPPPTYHHVCGSTEPPGSGGVTERNSCFVMTHFKVMQNNAPVKKKSCIKVTTLEVIYCRHENLRQVFRYTVVQSKAYIHSTGLGAACRRRAPSPTKTPQPPPLSGLFFSAHEHKSQLGDLMSTQ